MINLVVVVVFVFFFFFFYLGGWGGGGFPCSGKKKLFLRMECSIFLVKEVMYFFSTVELELKTF